MEIKKSYLEPELRERDLRLEGSLLESGAAGTVEDGTVVDYDDDFWS